MSSTPTGESASPIKMCDDYCGAEECLHGSKPNCQKALGNPLSVHVYKDSEGNKHQVYYFKEKRIAPQG
jgi:hypothetical protein